jgi:hypothetical protein
MEEYGFSIVGPDDSTLNENHRTIVEFLGNEKTYGAKARFVLSSIRPVGKKLHELESYMKDDKTVKMFDNLLVGSMKSYFPDIRSENKGFKVFKERPTIHGTFSFTVGPVAMKGRYMIILVAECSSLFTFTWSADNLHFNKWDKQSESSVFSIVAHPALTQDIALRRRNAHPSTYRSE